MFRKYLSGHQREKKDKIQWRSHEILRIEAFSDAVFAFALTLLIVSLEVPKSFHELYEGMRSFLPFSACFALVFQIWMVQNTFFRRYGLFDNTTLVLNAMLMFTVLFFVYPLKFLFGLIFLGNGEVEGANDVIRLFYIYSGGFAGIYFLFTCMYWNAYRYRNILGLTHLEVFETKTNIYRNASLMIIGLLSVLLAMCGSSFLTFAGFIYILIGPVIGILHKRRSKLYTPPQKLSTAEPQNS